MLAKMLYSLQFLGHGLLITLATSGLVVALALVVGLVFGAGVTYGPWFIAWPIRLFSDVIRGIPILVLIFFVYYGLPAVHVNLATFTAAVFALTLFSTAQVIEIVRGALQSIHHRQMEAGKAIGLTFVQRLAYVILPQALRRFLPPWINSVVDAVKGSALVSLIGISDLMLEVQKVAGRTYDALPVYIVGALIYFAINYALSTLSRRLEAGTAHIRD
jgi:polar amino acid transport system permease protein